MNSRPRCCRARVPVEFVRRHWIGLLAAIVALTALLILYWIARSTGAPTFDYEIR